jgi:hypothetical protein
MRTRMYGGVRGRGLAAPSYSMYARHGRHLYGESPEWGLASAYH